MKQVIARILFGGILLTASLWTHSSDATTLTATVWSDERYEVYVSHSDSEAGTLFLRGTGGEEAPQTASTELIEGAIQYLHILVKDDGADPSALIGSFNLSDFGFVFPNLFFDMSTDQLYWKVSRLSWESDFEFLTDLGVNGTAPFGQKAGIAGDAHYLWSEGEPGDRFFTLALLPTNSTPRRFVVGSQPEFNSIEDLVSKTEGVPNTLYYRDDPSEGMAVAFPGRVGARSQDSVAQGPGDLYTTTWASFDSPDFVLTTTGDETTADISLNFVVKGNLQGGAGKGGLPLEVSTASSRLQVHAQIEREIFHLGDATITARHEVGTENPGTEVTISDIWKVDLLPDDVSGDAGDFMAEYNVTIDKTFTTPVYTAEVGVPFSVELSCTVTSSAASDSGHALGKLDFTGGVSFPTSGDVFNLPPGFTINSISATIRDNVFEGDPSSKADQEKLLVPGLFMQIPDIPGESQTEGREEWIELSEVSGGLYLPTQGRSRASAVHEDVVVIKPIDKSSPKLAESLLNGNVFQEVMIGETRALPGNRWAQYEFLLSNAQVTSFDLSNSGGGLQPVEMFSFDFEKVDWAYRICDLAGTLIQRVEAYWDLLTDTGGSSTFSGGNTPPSMDPVENQQSDPASTNTVDVPVDDMETDPEDLQITVSTSDPDLIGDLEITGSGENLQISYTTSALKTGFASITVQASDGENSRSVSIPVLVGTELSPFEGFLAAYFGEDNLDDPVLASPIRDPDKDGIATVIEFLLGTNPNEFNLASEAIRINQTTGHEGRTFEIDFQRRLDDPNVQGYFWGSFDLEVWTRLDSSIPFYEESSQPGENPLYEQTKATISLHPESAPLFIRYQVTDVF